MRVKGRAMDLCCAPAQCAGQDATWLTPVAPLVVCACLDDPDWAEAAAVAPTVADLLDAEHYTQDGRRGRFLARRSILRTLAARMLGCMAADVSIAHDAQGAPQLTAPPGQLHVSVSGRGALAAFALSPRRIGIDLEPFGDPQPPAWNILHARERAWLDGLAGDARHAAFMHIWTVKEAYLKMLGLGLRIEPSNVAVRIEANGRAGVAAGGRGRPAAAANCWRTELGGQTVLVACASDL